jgi:membrane protease YdiL (CAAX protease family)
LFAAFCVAALAGPYSVALLLFVATLCLALEETRDGARAAAFLKLSSGKTWPFQIVESVKLCGFLFVVLLTEGLLLGTVGMLDSHRVVDVLVRQTPLTLLFAFTFAPLAEELFFRGYLQQKLGVVLTALVFGFLHAGFGSVFEVVAALSAGLIFGVFVKRTGNLVPAILAHALYNAYAVLVVTQFLS